MYHSVTKMSGDTCHLSRIHRYGFLLSHIRQKRLFGKILGLLNIIFAEVSISEQKQPVKRKLNNSIVYFCQELLPLAPCLYTIGIA